MNVIYTTAGNILIIAIEGSIDSNTAGDIQVNLYERVAEATNVLLDLSEVDFVSSAGLRMLLLIYRQIKSRNGKVILSGVSDEIKDIMALTGFINFFEIFKNKADALNSF